MPTGIFLVRHYIYDGCGRHDQDDVTFEWTYDDAKKHLDKFYKEYDNYEWVYDTQSEDFILIKKEGQYGYDYFYIQFAAPGEEID